MIRWFVNVNRGLAASLERRFPAWFGTEPATDHLRDRVIADIAARRPRVVVEAGGVDRPLIGRNPAYEYVGVDIDQQPGCADVYDRFIVQSIEKPLPVTAGAIVSHTLLEHVPDNRAAVNAIYTALEPGGVTHHFIPSKWHPYAIATRMVGPALQRKLIPILRPHAVGTTGYPTFFDHCSPGQMTKLFRSAGFERIEVKPYFRAADYFAFFIPAYLGIVLFENTCKALGWRMFCSGFIISAAKPAAANA